MRSAAVVAALSLAGCNAILGIGDVKPGAGVDAGADARPDASVPACPTPPPDTVIGCARITHVLVDNSTVVDNLDLSKLTIQAVLYDPVAMTFTTVPGAGTAEGVLTIEHVPDGKPYYLELIDPTAVLTSYYVTDRHSIDLDFTAIGRPGSPVTQATQVTVDMTNMTPWHHGDGISIDGFSIGAEVYVQPDPTTGPANGATTFKTTVDWRNAFEEQMFLFLAGIGPRPALLADMASDDLTVSHIAFRPVADATGSEWIMQTIVDTMRKSPAGMSDGAPLTVMGDFAATVPAVNGQQLGANLLATRAAFHDGGHVGADEFNCERFASPSAGGHVTGQPLWWVDSFAPPQVDNLTFPNLAYNAAYSPTWKQTMLCGMTRYRAVRAPGAKNGSLMTEFVRSWAPASTNYAFTPRLESVSSIKLNGVDVMNGGAAPFVAGKAQILSWTGAADASRYYVLLEHLIVNASGQQSRAIIATFHTTDTQLAIPPDTIVPGDGYVFRVGALRTSVDYSAGHLVDVGFPVDEARVATGAIRMSSTCGNGSKGADEACDTGGDSATCDGDCTVVLCGDGYVNAAANEQCDNPNPFGADSPTCDNDCTLPVCGDGYFNTTVEQCDDGNTADNDGCSHDCKLERCGNGTTDNFEGCDDQNHVVDDGCGPLCQVESGWNCDTTKTPSVCTRI